MHRPKTTAGRRKKQPAPPGEAAFTAACNLLLAGKSTREENRLAVRLLLRRASANKESCT